MLKEKSSTPKTEKRVYKESHKGLTVERKGENIYIECNAPVEQLYNDIVGRLKSIKKEDSKLNEHRGLNLHVDVVCKGKNQTGRKDKLLWVLTRNGLNPISYAIS